MNFYKHAQLVLEDGSVFEGFSFGYESSTSGELVFNTGMVGYVEALTDPSYYGQLLISTYPQVGNYGVPGAKAGISGRYESARIQARAFIVNSYSPQFDHWSSKRSLGDWLREEKTVGLFGLDTRALTRHLRDKGAMLAKIIIDDRDVPFYDPNKAFLLPEVSVKETIIHGRGAKKIALLDCGCKRSIIANLLNDKTTVVQLPYDAPLEMDSYDGLVISSGPGDPGQYQSLLPGIIKALSSGKPVMGICLGHQLMARAVGAATYKLKFGHRGQNQPVRETSGEACFVTSQNHGFAVQGDTLPPEWQSMYINLNDESNEGIIHKREPYFSVQFHPEAAPGPHDTRFLFERFFKLLQI